MFTLAMVTQKGGSGKTTLAANLAVAAAAAGETVLMLDLDPQRSLTAWRKDRRAGNIDVITTAGNTKEPMIPADKFASRPPTLVIVDCPGVNSTTVNYIMKQADLCLIPARPALIDIRAAKPTVQALVSLKRPFAFVLNQCTPGRITARTNEGREAIEIMAGLAGAIAEPMVGLRADYQDAIQNGYGVTEYAPDGKAADEMRHLWHWTKSRLISLTAPQDKKSHEAQKTIHGGAPGRGTASFGSFNSASIKPR